ncbi:Uncharacterized protein (Fragment) OS=uncultured bacterium PE=4 SV=1 [Gemmata massiliana]|uniref:SMI1/KNR4 family protein n=1 Tax=Gemmata massiliana TaxID=1210884 RepID=A0A6P2DH03_9BACT
MSEDEWLTGTDLTAHVRFALDRLSPRRKRLLAAGFCRSVSDLFDGPDLIKSLDVIERFADGRVPPAEVERARQLCREIAQRAYNAYARQIHDKGENGDALREWIRSEFAWVLAYAATTPLPIEDVGRRVILAAAQARVGVVQMMPTSSAELDEENAAQGAIMCGGVREIVGNPFRPPLFLRDWQTATAMALAAQMYESRDFSAMPILADALQDAGCDDEHVLAHCRGEGPHIRGCWVLDLVLGKD